MAEENPLHALLSKKGPKGRKCSAAKAGLNHRNVKTTTYTPSLPGCSKDADDSDIQNNIDLNDTPPVLVTQVEQADISLKNDVASIKEQLAQIIPTMAKMQEAMFTKEEDSSYSESSSDDEEVVESNAGLEHFMKLCDRTDKKGPSINEKLALGTTSMLSKGLKEEEKEKLFDKYLTPENCERLNVIQCNEEVYKSTSKNTRILDNTLQSIQGSLCKGISAVVSCFNKLLPLANGEEELTNETTSELTSMSADALALLTNASYSLDMHRKNNFQREFKAEYKSLCNDKEISGKLFGKDLKEKITEISEVNKVSSQVSRSKYSQRKRKSTNNSFLDKSKERKTQTQSLKKKFSFKKKSMPNKNKKQKKKE